MWHEIYRFEIKYRLKRPETYLFFIFLFAFSIFATDFIFQGVEIGLVRLNSPIVIGKTMGATTGIFLILASMIMGMPVLRDDQYGITPLIYTQPINRFDLLAGRFLGSFVILLIIFCGLPLGMMIGEFLPWHLDEEMHPFHIGSYLTTFFTIVFPILFFGASLFFVSGMLSRKLIVVYTQGVIFFVIFLLTKAITDEYLQAILDPFSLTTITQMTKNWTVLEKNTMQLPFNDALMVNKLFWIALGIGTLLFGYYKFSFSTQDSKRKTNKQKNNETVRHEEYKGNIDLIKPNYSLGGQFKQFYTLSIFYSKSLLKETSFWAIVICGIIIILINSISLGTVYGVDSYPTTYFIVEELQELSLYFFIIILLFYSGELYWKEHGDRMNLICDATPISSLIRLSSKMTGLVVVYAVLMVSLISAGITFQLINGYYHLDLQIYFTGFFIEILPFLVVYSFAAFFFQSLVNNKFLGILTTLVFFIVMVALGALDYLSILLNFGGGTMTPYSEMNGYGHFMSPYLWIKLYWFLFGIFLMIVASVISGRGVEVNLSQRLKGAKTLLTKQTQILALSIFILFASVGCYIYYQSHVLNKVWSTDAQETYRADYEKTLKQYEYHPQLSITSSNLHMELYPDDRSYILRGAYILKNENKIPIEEIHIQKLIESDVLLDSVYFSNEVSIDSQYQEYEYIIYHLETPLPPNDSLEMTFRQQLSSRGFNTGGSVGSVLYNGTFIRNNEFPTLGYNKKYELSDEERRKTYGFSPRPIKAEIDDNNEKRIARTGSDSNGITTKIVIGTDPDQIAVTSGDLIGQWQKENRNYYEYHSNQPIINFYSILSSQYDVLRDQWNPKDQSRQKTVELEIYHHPRHIYNLDRMMSGMKASLDYYSINFSAYPYEQLRIVEFPRYESFAQSFPNTIPFSESIGFMLDIDDAIDVDMTLFVTAHEVAHQWWGLQVEAANVKGQNFILETLSQYSALMVFKNQYSNAKVIQFLELQEELYNDGKNKSKQPEAPLSLVENEEHLYYNKGAIVMYELYCSIGEENINQALSSFIKDWNTQTGRIKLKVDRYATSDDLIYYLLDVTPQSKRAEIAKLLKEL